MDDAQHIRAEPSDERRKQQGKWFQSTVEKTSESKAAVPAGVRSNVADRAPHKASFNPGLSATQACFSAIATSASLFRML
jgi:hypothetical protein